MFAPFCAPFFWENCGPFLVLVIDIDFICFHLAPSKPRGVVLFPFVRMRYRYHYINVSWTAPEFPNGKSTRFSYTVQMGCSSVRCKRAFSGSPSTYEKDLINGKRHFIIGQSGGIMLEPFTEYSVQIKEKTGCLSCWGELSDVQRIKTLPGRKCFTLVELQTRQYSSLYFLSPTHFSKDLILCVFFFIISTNQLKRILPF